MANLVADVRHSTHRMLKLNCPSAEVVDCEIFSASANNSVHAELYPPIDTDGEYSDDEELILCHRRRTRYKSHYIDATTASPETSCDDSSYTVPSRSQMSKNASLSPFSKGPPSPRTGTDDKKGSLLQHFDQMNVEQDMLWRAQQKRKTAIPCSGPSKASIVYKSEENTLIEEIYALKNGIQIWTEEYFRGLANGRHRKLYLHGAKKLFGDLTEDPKVYLDHQEDRPLLIQAYIWSKLQQKVFNSWQQGCGFVWAGKLGDKQLRPLNDILRNAVASKAQAEEYHLWRANTVNLLVPQIDGKWRPTFDAASALKRISHLCNYLRSVLRPWSTRSLRLGKEQLRTIVSASVALDLKMKRQRADYRFVTFTREIDQCWGYDFFEGEMEDIHEGDDRRGRRGFGRESPRGRRVELALAPALERCGNTKGRDFDRTLILVRADVSCKKLEKPKTLPRATTDGGQARLGYRRPSGKWAKCTIRDDMVKRPLC